MHWLWIFLGGGAGACLRVALAASIDTRSGGAQILGFPWGIFAVNVIGCFAIGVFASFADEHGLLRPAARAFLVAGVLGGFTTYSTFGLDTFRLIEAGRFGVAGLNAVATLLIAMLGVAAGHQLARSLA